ncbi:MAG: histidinol-phosphatase HisJ family protein [Clostridiales bacterium]|nr:histidinol-phosphatase HisJ family protein [Clostridiales bacterium]
MIKFDLHTHTNFSFDSEQDICELILRAQKLGLKYLAITDHFDNGSKYATQELDISRYCQTLESFMGLAKNQGVDLLIGIEMGYMPAQNPQNAEIVQNYPFDYIINSVHEVDGIDCYFPEYHQGKDKRASYMAYFDKVLDSLDAPYYYSAVGHLGYVIRKAPYDPKEYKYGEFDYILDKILKKIIQKQKILEINTSAESLKEPVIPSLEVIKRYYELGGRLVTFGSDAHRAQKLAYNFETASKILKDIGFKYYTIVKNRQNIEIKI